MAHRPAHRQPSYVRYTSAWMNDLVSWRSPSRATSTDSAIPMVEVDYSAKERRRWTRCVCASFLLSLLVNIFSTTFVVLRLNSQGAFTEDELVQEFLQQDGSSEVLQHIQHWKAQNTEVGKTNGSSPHWDATPDAIHMILDTNYNVSSKCDADGSSQRVSGWKPLTMKFLHKHKITTDGQPISKLTITEPGVYQIYSQLSFDGPNTTTQRALNYRQTLVDDHGTILLEDKETKQCRSSVNSHIPCHVSSLFAALYLEAKTEIHIEASPVNCIVRNDKCVSFFGIFKLV